MIMRHGNRETKIYKKEVFLELNFRFAITLDLKKCLKQIKLLISLHIRAHLFLI